MILFCITSLNNMMHNLLIEKASRDTVVLVSDRQEVISALENTGIAGSILMPLQIGMTVTKVDKLFSDIALPGLFGDSKFPNTNLPMHSVLSLDRLKFWFNPLGEIQGDFIHDHQFTEVYLSMDLGSSLPWQIYLAALTSNARIVGVQTEDIRTPEFLHFVNTVRFDEIIVLPDNGEFIKKVCKTKTTVRGQEKTGKKRVGSQEKLELRKGYGISGAENAIGIIFDKRDEWQCRMWLNQAKFNDEKWFVYPVDNRSRLLAGKVLWSYLPMITIVNDKKILYACDKVVAFRYYHEGFDGLPMDFFDYYDLNKVEKLL